MKALLRSSKLVTTVLASFAYLTGMYALYLTFVIAPNERIMGPIQRILYFHVGCAVACYTGVAVVLIASLGYLASRSSVYDAVSHAASEVSFIFCSIVMITGMLWGHTAWNTWFRWEPRLVSFLILWLILLSFLLLRVFGEPSKIPAHSAVLGIIGALMVPVVVFSIRLLPSMAQLHPQVVENRGLKDPRFESALFSGITAMFCLFFYLLWLRLRIELLHRKEQI